MIQNDRIYPLPVHVNPFESQSRFGDKPLKFQLSLAPKRDCAVALLIEGSNVHFIPVCNVRIIYLVLLLLYGTRSGIHCDGGP